MNGSAEEHRGFQEDLPGYLLGSLAEADRVALEAHLDQCERCRSELDWLRPTVGVLASSVPQLDPPRRQRRRTIAAARADERPTGARGWLTALGRPRPATLGLAAAAVAIVVAIAVSSLDQGSGPGSTTVALQAAAPATGAGGSLVVRDDTATLEVARLPDLPPSQVYEAWVQRDGEISPSSTFIVDRNGAGATTIPGVEGADRVMVTREPRGGSDQPTTVPLVSASL